MFVKAVSAICKLRK